SLINDSWAWNANTMVSRDKSGALLTPAMWRPTRTERRSRVFAFGTHGHQRRGPSVSRDRRAPLRSLRAADLPYPLRAGRQLRSYPGMEGMAILTLPRARCTRLNRPNVGIPRGASSRMQSRPHFQFTLS